MTRIIGALAAIAAWLTLPLAASATPSYVQFSFDQGATTTYSATYAVGPDIMFQQSLGGYTLNISAGASSLYGVSAYGTDPFLSFAIQVGNVGATPPLPIRIGMTVTGLAAPAAAAIGFNSSFTGIFQTGSSASFQTFLDPGNTAFGRTVTLAQFDGLSRQSNSYDETVQQLVSQTYSMSLFTTLSPAAYAHPTLDGQLTANPATASDTATPEPATAALVFTALAGLMAVRRRRR